MPVAVLMKILEAEDSARVTPRPRITVPKLAGSRKDGGDESLPVKKAFVILLLVDYWMRRSFVSNQGPL
jgi:hypothetical protein